MYLQCCLGNKVIRARVYCVLRDNFNQATSRDIAHYMVKRYNIVGYLLLTLVYYLVNMYYNKFLSLSSSQNNYCNKCLNKILIVIAPNSSYLTITATNCFRQRYYFKKCFGLNNYHSNKFVKHSSNVNNIA